MLEKLKSLLADDAAYFGAILIVTTIASFGLGRQSVRENALPPPALEAAVLTATPATVPLPSKVPLAAAGQAIVSDSSTGVVVGSKSGTKYHLPSCSGAKRIKPENLVTFASVAEAEAAGYTPAANCPGLQ